MSRAYDAVFLPKEYTAFGDKLIRNLPLIDTSLSGLAECGWWLAVQKRYYPTHHHTRVHYQFYDKKEPNKWLGFKLWVHGHILNHEVIETLIRHDLTPNFNRVPMFRLQAVPAIVQVRAEEDELKMLERINAERKARLALRPRSKKLDISKIQERLDNVIEFPTPSRNLRVERFLEETSEAAVSNR